jgi:hypothetical protein
MKRTALLAAAAAAMIATPAAADNAGYIGGGYNQLQDDFGDTDGWQGEAGFGTSGAGWGGQIDGSVGRFSDESGDEADTYNVNGHLYWQGGSWRFGGFAGYSSIESGGVELQDTTVGLVGSYALADTTTLTGALTGGNVEFLGVDIDAINFDVGLDFLQADNFRATINAGYGQVELSGVEGDTTTFGINAEWQPEWSLPVSFTGGYNYFNDDGFFGAETNSIGFGARWNFSGASVRERANATPFRTQTSFAQRAFDIR